MERKVVKADVLGSLDPRLIWRNLLPGRPRVDFLSVQRSARLFGRTSVWCRLEFHRNLLCHRWDRFTTAVASSVSGCRRLLLLRFAWWHRWLAVSFFCAFTPPTRSFSLILEDRKLLLCPTFTKSLDARVRARIDCGRDTTGVFRGIFFPFFRFFSTFGICSTRRERRGGHFFPRYIKTVYVTLGTLCFGVARSCDVRGVHTCGTNNMSIRFDRHSYANWRHDVFVVLVCIRGKRVNSDETGING